MLEDIKEFLDKALVNGVRGNLLTRAYAWSSMRKNGEMKENAPGLLSLNIETDLSEYGFSVLRAALKYKELGGDQTFQIRAFEAAGKAFEALSTNCADDLPEKDFYKILTGSCYHLAGFSAMAFSIINHPDVNNLTPVEHALRLLILRDIGQLKEFLNNFLSNADVSDDNLALWLEMGEIDEDDVISVVLNVSGCRALAYFEFALQTGETDLLEAAKAILVKAIDLATNSNNVPHYWVLRLILHLIDDLWASSLHKNLPVILPTDQGEQYPELRELFLATLYRRKNAEVELWPSQLDAAKRSVDLTDDLVVALPTSAGKTRIAELTCLMTLASGRRVLIVTPLRALSAQTERSFRATFAPLGFKVSSLYGASGSSGDEDALRTNNIIISTPEKIDFALRNDPSIIDDVGLVVLDEGHLIGPKEREIRFEILVQKLLNRVDSESRRIVCLSAILPTGVPLQHLTSWIRKDKEGEPITIPWRPTRQRFGTIIFQGESAKLNFGQEDDQGFISKFLETDPKGYELKLKNGDLKEMTMTSAWKFAMEGKRVLVFITTASWVAGYGKIALQLVSEGYLPSLIENDEDIKRVVQIGEEWLGANHPAVKALKIGVGLHHGKLPNPFLRELEILLSQGKIRITVASPTLSQGLNINAAVLLVPYTKRGTTPIEGEEFANVAGRAGRAFVDTEGLVLHVIHNQVVSRKKEWFELVKAARYRNLESGILQVITKVLLKLSGKGILQQEDAFEYLANNINAWNGLTKAELDAGQPAEIDLETTINLEMLDAMVFGLVEALDTDDNNLPQILDAALNSSLWERQIASKSDGFKKLQKDLLLSRAKLIWKNTTPQTRKGHFAMGVGLEAGLKIDLLADELADNLDKADIAALDGNIDDLTSTIIGVAEHVLEISPFKPDKTIPASWRSLLSLWISGASVDTIGDSGMKFIEDVLVYKLVWAMESIRVRRIASGWEPEHLTGSAAACLETGTFRFQTAMLIRAGLPSRIAAIRAIEETKAIFTNREELRDWLRSDYVQGLSNLDTWPTPETYGLWNDFRNDALRREGGRLRKNIITGRRIHSSTQRPINGIYRLVPDEKGVCSILTPDFKNVGHINRKLIQGTDSLMSARFSDDSENPTIHHIGYGRLEWE